MHERANRALLLDSENDDARNFVAGAERALGGDVQAQPPALEPSVAYPTSFANGRHEVKDFLGEGGKKRVESMATVAFSTDCPERHLGPKSRM